MRKKVIKTKSKEVQSHIRKAFKIIDDWLPHNYLQEVLTKFEEKDGITPEMVYNVKKKRTYRADILNAMVEVALKHKKEAEKLKKLTTK